MEEKKQSFLATYRCLVFIVVLMVVAIILALVRGSIGGGAKGTVYTASAMGLESEVTVSITVDDDGVIAAVSIDASGETAEIGGAAATQLEQTILDTDGDPAFDAITDATVTSEAIRTALIDCLGQAGREVETAEEEPEGTVSEGGYAAGTYSASARGMESDVTVTITIDENGVITDCEVDSSKETATFGALVSDPTSSYYIIDKILEAQSADFDGISGVTMTSKAVKSALADCLEQAQSAGAAPAAGGSYKAGTYTASARGMESDVAVTITIDENGVITDCEVDSSKETATFGALVSDPTSSYYIIDRILEAQSADFDGISGVTMTSKAVKSALEDCLEQASE